MGIHKILIGVDGSKNDQCAIEYVADIPRRAGGFPIKLLSTEHLPDRDFFSGVTAWKKACVRDREKPPVFLADSPERRHHLDRPVTGHLEIWNP